MTEFRIAHQLVTDGRKRFLIPLLLEDLAEDDLDSDLQLYIKTHTYTDCKDLVRLKNPSDCAFSSILQCVPIYSIEGH